MLPGAFSIAALARLFIPNQADYVVLQAPMSAARRCFIAVAAWFGAQVSLGLLGCEPTNSTTKVSGPNSGVPAQGSKSAFSAFTTTWAAETRSPRDTNAPNSLEALQVRCGRADASLAKVAGQLLALPGFGVDFNDIDLVGFAMRSAGVPYVWPRAWSVTVPANSETMIAQRFDAWLQSFNDGGQRRCGLSSELNRVAAVAVDVLADVVLPLPTQARTGQWLELRARLLEPASDAKVLLEGPTGEPVFVPATLDASEVRSRFPLASPGQWLVQVMATMQTGPRPVAEATIFVDQTPSRHPDSTPAPGESAKGRGSDIAGSLFAMLNQARLEEGRKALVRDPQLDRLAAEHARTMQEAGHVGHDVGDGSPKLRLESAGIFASLAGENVVHAADAQRAHRALWASPSHRTNILHRGFRNVGLGAFVGPDRTIWACELFATLD